MSDSPLKKAMLRSMLLAATPESKEELFMLADALRMYQAHPELRSEIMAKVEVTPDRLLSRIAMVMAIVKWGVEPATVPDDVPEDYKPPTEGDGG